MDTKRVAFKRHHDDELIDSVSIECVPRYKTSGLSGDEWRVSYRVRLGRKGTVLYDRNFTSLNAATTALPWLLLTMFEGNQDGFDDVLWMQRIAADETTCHQVGCQLPAVLFVALKDEFADNGEGPLPANTAYTMARGFCVAHAERGDCGREDADHNHTPIATPTTRVRS